MPYIRQERREVLNNMSKYNPPQTPGELNYQFTQAMIYSETKKTLDQAFATFSLGYILEKELGYATINDIMGALICAGAEWAARTGKSHCWQTDALKDYMAWFYKDIATPYEKDKRAKNGDVYPVRLGGTAKEEWPKYVSEEERDLIKDISLLSGAFIKDDDLSVGQAPIGQYGPETA